MNLLWSKTRGTQSRCLHEHRPTISMLHWEARISTWNQWRACYSWWRNMSSAKRLKKWSSSRQWLTETDIEVVINWEQLLQVSFRTRTYGAGLGRYGWARLLNWMWSSIRAQTGSSLKEKTVLIVKVTSMTYQTPCKLGRRSSYHSIKRSDCMAQHHSTVKSIETQSA